MSTITPAGTAPARFTATALYLDGDRAIPQQASVTVDEDTAAIEIVTPGGSHLWPLSEIRELPDQAGGDLLVLRLADDPVQRLILPDRALSPRLPNRTRRAPVARRGWLAAWALAAVASVAVIILVLVPRMADQLANFIPPGGERALGEATLTQVRGALDQTGLRPIPFCTRPDGAAALARLEARLTDGLDLPQPLSVHVLDHEMVNAFALPGGYVVFFRGLIDEAESPDEVAAVFAHEIGHVISRDPTRRALRSAGSIGVLGLLFGDFAGGALVLFLAEQLIEASYSREAEMQADLFAHRALRDADLPPAAIGTFFERMREKYGDADGLVAHFLSHPRMGDRIAAARAATPDDATFRPALTASEWRALQRICR